MEKIITGKDLLSIQDAFEELFESDVKIKLSEAASVLKLKSKIDEYSKDFIDGIIKVIPNIIDNDILSEEEQQLYDLLLMSPITIDIESVSFGFLTVGDIEMLSNDTIKVLLQYF